jgi:hypothetical protein
MNNEHSMLNDAALDEVAGGFNFGSFFGIPSAPSLPRAPSPKSFFSLANNYVISHSPIGAIGHALTFW